jgi:hypothetical protein
MMIWRKSSFSPNADDCVEIGWRKSSFSPNGGDCVEVAWPTTAVAVRDSKNADGPVLDFPRSAWSAFRAFH